MTLAQIWLPQNIGCFKNVETKIIQLPLPMSINRRFLTLLMGSDPHPLRFGSKGLFRTTWCLRGSWSDARLRWRTSKQPECMGAHPAKYIVYYCVILRSPVSALACLNQRVNFTFRSLFWSPFCCVWHSLPVLRCTVSILHVVQWSLRFGFGLILSSVFNGFNLSPTWNFWMKEGCIYY